MVKCKTKDLFRGVNGLVRTHGEKDCWKFRWLLRRNKPSVSVKNIYGMRHLVDRRYADTFPCILPEWWSSRFYEVLSLMKPLRPLLNFLSSNSRRSLERINNLKKHERAKRLAIYGESMIEQSSMTYIAWLFFFFSIFNSFWKCTFSFIIYQLISVSSLKGGQKFFYMLMLTRTIINRANCKFK